MSIDLTPEREAEIRTAHFCRETPHADYDYCDECLNRWPCPTIQVLDALHAERQRAEQAESAVMVLGNRLKEELIESHNGHVRMSAPTTFDDCQLAYCRDARHLLANLPAAVQAHIERDACLEEVAKTVTTKGQMYFASTPDSIAWEQLLARVPKGEA